MTLYSLNHVETDPNFNKLGLFRKLNDEFSISCKGVEEHSYFTNNLIYAGIDTTNDSDDFFMFYIASLNLYCCMACDSSKIKIKRMK